MATANASVATSRSQAKVVFFLIFFATTLFAVY